MRNELKTTLIELLSIPSPTFEEEKVAEYILQKSKRFHPQLEIKHHDNSLIINFPGNSALPHIALVGHSDVVPNYFNPYEENGKIYGAGASDMKGSLACYPVFLENYWKRITEKYQLTFIVYAREEGTGLEQNGLYDLLQHYPNEFKKLDLAIIGEPTNNHIQLGCVGSIHAQVTFIGKACHSARPWDGKNALYEALPCLEKISKFTPQKHTVFGVDFHDVLSVTMCNTPNGRTTIPAKCILNINYRFAPTQDLDIAKTALLNLLEEYGAKEIEIIDAVPSGKVIETQLFTAFIQKLACPIEAKQAWTDVAQFTAAGIPAFNFGPGLTQQAHRPDEHIVLDDIITHYQKLESIL